MMMGQLFIREPVFSREAGKNSWNRSFCLCQILKILQQQMDRE